MKKDQPALRLVFSRDDSTTPNSKYANNRSTCSMPGLVVSPRPIFSSVRSGTPLPAATSAHLALLSLSFPRTRLKMESCMPADTKPINGFVQPANGLRSQLKYDPMPKGTKKTKPPSFSRALVSANVIARMKAIYGGYGDPTKALAEAAGLSLSTVQRVIGRDVGASVDTLEALAGALDCSIPELFNTPESVMRALGVTRVGQQGEAHETQTRPSRTGHR